MDKENIKKNNETKNTILKNKLVIIGKILALLVVIGIILLVIFSNKDKDLDDIKLSELSYVEAFKEANEAKAAKVVKENIVKITNTIDEDTNLIGTGFFIKDGYLLTNSHVVDVLGDVTIEYADGNKAKAYLYANSIEYDVALLKVEDVSVKALSFGNSTAMEVTNNVLAAGYIYNFAGEATISKGILSARRNIDALTYLQTDISIDTGASGGPLFNDKAEVIGLNTFVTENRTFALSISSETINMIVTSLIKEPTIQYLTDKRPSNSINKILVEVNYTEDDHYCLYNDDDIIEKSKHQHKSELEDLKNNDKISTSFDGDAEYTCESGYILIGKSCFKQEFYDGKLVYDSCPNGYSVQNDYSCVKISTKPSETGYSCSDPKYKVNSDNKCEYEGYIMDGSKFASTRLGSCPKGETCYEYAADFGDFAAAPLCRNDMPSRAIFVWEGEEVKKENYKTFSRGIYNFVQTKLKDKDGLIYYKNISINDKDAAYMGCYESVVTDDAGKKIYIMKKIDSIRSTACPEGNLKAVNNDEGFGGYYCLLDVKPSLFYYNITCSNPDAIVKQDNDKSEPYCAVYKKTYLNPLTYQYCPDKDYSIYNDQNTCEKHNVIVRPSHYECPNGGKLNNRQCFIEIHKPAQKD